MQEYKLERGYERNLNPYKNVLMFMVIYFLIHMLISELEHSNE